MAASLTHVYMWTEHGWKKITAEEASELYPETVSAHGKLFACGLCHQYVTLTNGEHKIRYFKHSAYEKSKDCPERTFASGNIPVFEAKDYQLPIKITNISSSDFILQIGFLYIAQDILQQAYNQFLRIIPEGTGEEPLKYSFERLNEDRITYLSAGRSPAERYRIECDASLHSVWPDMVKGISREGRIFDGSSGIMVMNGADVQVGKKYYLLCRNSQISSRSHLEVNQICRKRTVYQNWYVYEIEATAYSEDASKFFLDWNCWLNEKPLVIHPLWPLYEETPYLIKYNRDSIYFHINGQSPEEINARTYPTENNIIKFNTKDAGKVIKVTPDDRQQMVSAGKTQNILQYLYLWKERIDDTTDEPVIEVKDSKGQIISGGIMNTLPDGKAILFNPMFDGFFTISDGRKIREKRKFTANSSVQIDNLSMGLKIDITQGLDIVWSIIFERRKSKSNSDTDIELAQKLKGFSGPKVKVGHNLGSVAERLSGYPETKKWIYSQIKSGVTSERALKYLTRFLSKEC